MTHEELLKQIDDIEYPWCMQDTLRAVVELHKPVMAFTGGYDGANNELWAEQCSDCSNNGFSQMYPCQTIKVIELNLQ